MSAWDACATRYSSENASEMATAYAGLRGRISSVPRRFDPEDYLRASAKPIDMREPWRAPKCTVIHDWTKSERAFLAKRQGDHEVLVAGTAAFIIRETAYHYGFEVHDLKGPWRAKMVTHARHVAMWRLRCAPPVGPDRPLSFPQIGRIMGGRDHTTAISAYYKIQALIDEGRAI